MTDLDHQEEWLDRIPDDLFITDELASRPLRRDASEVEMMVMCLVARQMANDPDHLLPAFVKHAMALTDADASGLALVSEAEPLFVTWRYLHGLVEPFEGLRSQRIQALVAEALRSRGAMLLSHPERVFDWIAEAQLVFPDVLAVPLHVREKYAGTLWVASTQAKHFDNGDARLLVALSEFVGIALDVSTQLADLRKALDDQVTIALEMRHRLKNIFAVADALVRATAKNASTPDAMVDAITGRLHAMEKAQNLLRDVNVQKDTDFIQADFATLITEIGRPLWQQSPGDPCPVLVAGPAVACGEHATNGLALIVHELATNAVKYGALARPGGQVEITWTCANGRLSLNWMETGAAPLPAVTVRKGFGTTLVDRTISTQFHGTVERCWHSDGLELKLSMSLADLAT